MTRQKSSVEGPREKALPWKVGTGTNLLGVAAEDLVFHVICAIGHPSRVALLLCVSENQLIWREHRKALCSYSQRRCFVHFGLLLSVVSLAKLCKVTHVLYSTKWVLR